MAERPPSPPDPGATVRADLTRVLSAIAVVSGDAVRFAGGDPVPVQGAAGSDEALTQTLQHTLYSQAYAHRLGGPPAVAPPPDPAFLPTLVAANTGREQWNSGWVIQLSAPNGQVFVKKGERERVAQPGSFILDNAVGGAPQPGNSVLLRVPAGAIDAQPGWYFAFGETLDEAADQFGLMRLYFNCAATTAPGLLGALTQALNRFQTPFQMKAPSDAALYGRTDALVLYVAPRYLPIVLRIVDGLRGGFALNLDAPLFAKPIWPGIAGAADPGKGESFGMHRCRLVSEAVVQAWRAGVHDPSEWLEAVDGRFVAAGLDPARPWLGRPGGDPFQRPVG